MRHLIDECLNALVQNLQIISESGQDSEMKRIFGAYSMEVILQVEFRIKVNVLFDKTKPIIKYAKKTFNRNLNPKILIALLAQKLAKILKISNF